MNWSQDVYAIAFRFAAEAHNGQLFPGTDLPYLVHISLVCMEVIAALNDENHLDGNLAIQCALLHDVIEDTEVGYEDIQAEFGDDVSQGVLALTKDDTLDKEERMADSLERILSQPHEVWVVKLADRITNLAPPPDFWSKDNIIGYRDEAIEIHEALHKSSKNLGIRLLEKIDGYGLDI